MAMGGGDATTGRVARRRSAAAGVEDGAVKARARGGAYPLVQLGGGLTARLMAITPGLAAEWLGKNPRVQRGLGPTAVAMIGRAIAADGWKVNGATIVFGGDGRLYDGQHRLSAIANGDRAMISLVVWGVDPEAFETMDIGRGARSAGQVLAAAGLPYANALASAVQYLWRLGHGLVPSHGGYKGRAARVRLSPTEILAYLAEHPEVKDSPGRAQPVFKLLHSTGVPVAFHVLAVRRDPEAASRFFESLASGAGLERLDPILSLRERCLRAKIGDAELFWTLATAWNAWRLGQRPNPRSWRPAWNEPMPDLV